MIRRSASPKKCRRGAVAVVVTLCLIPLLGILAFAIDGGMMLASKRRAQTVADAAAHAAACQLYTNTSTDPTGLDVSGKARAAALLNASANGFTNDGTTNKVQVNIPPSTLSQLWQTKPFYAEVVVTYYQPRFFSAILGSGSLPIGARAVARGTAGGPKAYSDASLIVLSATNSANALQVSGAGNLNAQSTVQDNSSNAMAFNVNGGGIVKAPSIQVTGGSSITGGSSVTGTVLTAAPRIADPLAGVVAPDPASMTAQSYQPTWQPATINPGVYSNGITSGSGAITMNPGVYYLKGSGLSIGNGATLTGTGVTIYMDSGAQLNLMGGTVVTLTPPTTGTFAGLTYFQNRTNNKPLNITNGANFTASGTIYAPDASAVINGGTSNKYGSQLILDTFTLSNGAAMTLPTKTDSSLGYVASGTSSASINLVE